MHKTRFQSLIIDLLKHLKADSGLIKIAGERISVPPDAVFNIEHERKRDNEEVEFQLKWVVFHHFLNKLFS